MFSYKTKYVRHYSHSTGENLLQIWFEPPVLERLLFRPN